MNLSSEDISDSDSLGFTWVIGAEIASKTNRQEQKENMNFSKGSNAWIGSWNHDV